MNMYQANIFGFPKLKSKNFAICLIKKITNILKIKKFIIVFLSKYNIAKFKNTIPNATS